MVTLIPIALLKPHPKNRELFSDPLPENIWKEMVEDIRENGVMTPLIVVEDCVAGNYTILAGHQRWEAAKQVGLTHIPAIVRKDVDPDSNEAVALLIKDNLLRRQLNDMQVAKLIRLLKEKYGVKHGGYRELEMVNISGSSGQNGRLIEVADLVGLPERTVRRLDKLNDLIPEFQALVSSGKLGTTAAEQIAYLSPEAQAEIYRQIKEQITEMTVAEVKELRRKVEEKEQLEKELEQARAAVQIMESRAIEAEDELNDIRRELSNIQDWLEEAIKNARKEEREATEEEIAKLQEKVNRLSERAEKLRQDKEKAEARVKEIEEKLASARQAVEEQFRKDLADKEKRIKVLEKEIAGLNQKIAELESRPPEVIEKAPEDYEELKQMIRTLKREKEKAESELLGLTREQIEQKDRYWVRDIVTKMAQDVGKHVTKLRYEMERRSIDAVAYKDIMDCADLLAKIAGELRDMVSLRERGEGDYVEIVV